MNLLLFTFLITLLGFICFWLIQVKLKDAGVVDIYWGPGFAVIVFIYIAFHQNTTPYLCIISVSYTHLTLPTIYSV